MLGAAAAAVTARALYRAAVRSDAADRWQRTNHRGESVTLLEGPAVGVGALAGVVMTPGIPGRVRGAALVAGAAATAFGALDDLAPDASDKGLRGHLGAMAQGRLTSGGVKVLGIGVTGVLAAATVRRGRGGLFDTLLAGTVVAGGANVVNLLDLRPGRAAKAVLLAGSPALLGTGTAGDVVAAPMGAAAALLREDLREEAMLGDAGANALGAVLGVAAASSLPTRALAALAAAIVGLTLASERVSFSDVIDATPQLRVLDRLGRRPVA